MYTFLKADLNRLIALIAILINECKASLIELLIVAFIVFNNNFE